VTTRKCLPLFQYKMRLKGWSCQVVTIRIGAAKELRLKSIGRFRTGSEEIRFKGENRGADQAADRALDIHRPGAGSGLSAATVHATPHTSRHRANGLGPGSARDLARPGDAAHPGFANICFASGVITLGWTASPSRIGTTCAIIRVPMSAFSTTPRQGPRQFQLTGGAIRCRTAKLGFSAWIRCIRR